MLKKTISCIIIEYLISCQFIIFVDSNKNLLYKTIYVDEGGNTDFSKIQYAINASLDGDITFVYYGTYNIRVKAKNIIGVESEWSDPFTVELFRNKNKISYLFDFFNELLNELFKNNFVNVII